MAELRSDPEADPSAEVDQLRARVRELESQLRDRRSAEVKSKPEKVAPGWMKALLVALAGMLAVLAPLAVDSIRRFIRWWRL